MAEHPVATRTDCRGCTHAPLEVVLDYGPMPLAGGFPKPQDAANEPLFRLQLAACPACGLVQVPQVVPGDVLFRDYRYRASIPLAGHFARWAEEVPERIGLRPDGRIVEPG